MALLLRLAISEWEVVVVFWCCSAAQVSVGRPNRAVLASSADSTTITAAPIRASIANAVIAAAENPPVNSVNVSAVIDISVNTNKISALRVAVILIIVD